MRHARIAFVLLAFICAVHLGAEESADAQKQFETMLKDAKRSGGSQTNLAILQLARELGLLEKVSLTDLPGLVDRTRTDQQLTSSSSTPGAVRNLEKPGIADLLSFAVERGAISEEKDATNATLSTTPYAFLTGFGTADSPDNWEKLRWARRLSLSTTFSNEDIEEGNFSNFVAAQAKYVVLGNRSGRDVVLMKQAGETLDAALQRAMGDAAVNCQNFLNTPGGQAFDSQTAEFDEWLATNRLTASLGEIAAQLDALVTVPTNPLDAASEQQLNTCVASLIEMRSALDVDAAQLKALTDTYLARNKRHQLSVAGLFQRDPVLSDYTTIKLLYANDLAGFTANLNGEISFNQSGKSAAGAELDQIRAYSVEAGLNTGKTMTGRADSTLSLKWYRPEEDDSDYVLSVQGLLNLHLTPTFKLPLALSYANRTLTAANAKQGWQLEFGVAALLDHLLTSR